MNKDNRDELKIIKIDDKPSNNLDNKVKSLKENDLKENKKMLLIILSVIIIIFLLIIFSIDNDNLSVFYGDYDSEYGMVDKKDSKNNSSTTKTTLKNSVKKSLSSSKAKSTTSNNSSNNNSQIGDLEGNNSSYEEDIFDDNFDNSTSSLPDDLQRPDPPEYPNIEDDEVDLGDIANNNNFLINKILLDYGVSIKVNNKIDKYFDKYLLIKYLDDKKINQMLIEIDREFSKYPKNFFKEFKIRGSLKHLNLVLIDKIDYVSLENNRPAVGIVDIDYNDQISIIYRYVGGNFNKNIHYYMMYVIDYYLNMNHNLQEVYNNFISLNPINFNYGNINSSLSYKNNKKGSFLSDFSQQNDFFDRASIFSVMMTDTRQQDYFNRGQNIRKKLDSIIFTISKFFSSANGFNDVNSWNNKLN
ncbi:MAG: hypothetical protein KFW09_04345 [Oscillospiraceae bacterium]|nr:hypothetical protein [Oscillospiraceae bacterium]